MWRFSAASMCPCTTFSTYVKSTTLLPSLYKQLVGYIIHLVALMNNSLAHLLAHPMMNFIFPDFAALTTVGTSWGSRGPNIPWGLTATVKISLPSKPPLDSSTICRGTCEW